MYAVIYSCWCHVWKQRPNERKPRFELSSQGRDRLPSSTLRASLQCLQALYCTIKGLFLRGIYKIVVPKYLFSKIIILENFEHPEFYKFFEHCVYVLWILQCMNLSIHKTTKVHINVYIYHYYYWQKWINIFLYMRSVTMYYNIHFENQLQKIIYKLHFTASYN